MVRSELEAALARFVHEGDPFTADDLRAETTAESDALIAALPTVLRQAVRRGQITRTGWDVSRTSTRRSATIRVWTPNQERTPMTDELLEAARARADRIRMGMESLANLKTDIVDAYNNADHLQLGYDSWNAYVEAEFIEITRMRLSRDERRELVSTLESEANMSTRAIAAVTGVNQATIQRDQTAGDANATPAKLERSSRSVQGRDGKNYPDTPARSTREAPSETTDHAEDDDAEEAEVVAETTDSKPEATSGPAAQAPEQQTPPKPRRAPLDKSARNAGHNLRLAANRVANVVHDDRFRQNRDQITRIMRRDLVHALETAHELLERMPEIDQHTGELIEK